MFALTGTKGAQASSTHTELSAARFLLFNSMNSKYSFIARSIKDWNLLPVPPGGPLRYFNDGGGGLFWV